MTFDPVVESPDAVSPAQASGDTSTAPEPAPASGDEPRPEPTVVRELVEKRGENITQYLLSDGQVRAEITEVPTRHRDDDGDLVDIVPALVPGEEPGTVETLSTPLDLVAGAQSGAEAPVALSGPGYAVGIDYLGAAEQARVVYGDTTRYLGVAHDTDLEYRALRDGIKETVVLKSAEAPGTHTFRLALDGLEVRRDPVGAYALYREGGTEPVLDIGRLEVFDSSRNEADEPVYCEAATMTVEPAGPDHAFVTYEVSPEWLSAPERVFPVQVDPTLTGNTNGQDTFVSSAYPSTNYGSDGELKCGYYDSTTGRNRSLLRFFWGSADVPPGAYVSSARLRAFMHHQYYADVTTNVRIARVNESWSSGSVTWNTKPDDYTFIGTEDVRGRNQWVEFEAGPWVQGWVNDYSTNHGFQLYQQSNSTEDTYYWKKFRASNYSDTTKVPRLVVTYSNPGLDHAAAALDKSVYRVGDTVTARIRMGTGIPEDVNCLEVHVNGTDQATGSRVRRGTFIWTKTAPSPDWETATVCPGTGGGRVSQHKTADTPQGGTRTVDLLETSCQQTVSASNDWAEVVFKWRIQPGYSDVQAADIDVRVKMDPADKNDLNNRWTSVWKRVNGTVSVAPGSVKTVSVEATSHAKWFRESVDSSGVLHATNDDPAAGRGSLVASWTPATGAKGYKVLLSDGNTEREIGRTFGSTATTFTTSGLGVYPRDSDIPAAGFPATRNPFGSSPLDASAFRASVTSTQSGTGVVVTDGQHVYAKRWGGSYPGPTAWTRIATKANGEMQPATATPVGAASGRDVFSAAYIDGFIYEGYAVTSRTVEGVAKTAPPWQQARATFTLDEPLLRRYDGVEVTSPTGDIMISADTSASRLYAVSHVRGTGSATFKVREYRINDNSTGATFIADRVVSFPGQADLTLYDGVFAAQGNLYVIEWSGGNRVMRIDTRTWRATGLWTVDGGNAHRLITACFDPSRRMVYAGALDKGTIRSYTGPGLDLRDDPSRLYRSTPGTSTDDNDGYFLRVVPFNGAPSDPATSTNAGAWHSLDNRTVRVGQDPRHTTYDLGDMAGADAQVQLEAASKSLALGVTDLAVDSYGPPVALTRSYDSGASHSGYLAPGWRFGFEQRLTPASQDATLVTYIDGGGESHTFKREHDQWFSPNGFVGWLEHHENGLAPDTWTLTLKDRSVIEFDDEGTLLSHTDAYGNAATYESTDTKMTMTAANGQRIEVDIDDGRAVAARYVTADGERTVAYSFAGDDMTVTDNPGVADEEIRTVYRQTGALLTSVEIADEEFNGAPARWDVAYDAGGAVQKVTGPASAAQAPRPETTFAWSYDAERQLDVARVERTADVSGAPQTVIQEFASNPSGTMAYMTNPRVAPENTVYWTYAYAPTNEVVEERSPTGKVTHRVLDSNSNVVFAYDEERHLDSFTYDEHDRLTRHVDARGCATYHGYGETPQGQTPRRAPLWSERVLNEAEHARTEYEYDARGLTQLVRSHIDGDRWVAARFGEFAPNGEPQRTTIEAQRRVAETYTAEAISLGGTATVGSIVTTASIDALGQVRSRTDAGGTVIMRDARYSPAGKLLRFEDTDGVVTHNRYDALGNLVETSQTVEATSGPTFANWRTLKVDALGRVIEEKDLGEGGATNATTRRVFDASGRETAVWDSVEGTTTTWYDARGTVVAQWLPGADTGILQQASRLIVDADGVERAEIEAGKDESQAIRKEWRPDGLLLKITDADGSWIRYEYDDGGLQTAQISPTQGGQEIAERTYYDIAGRVIEQVSIDGMRTRTTYDRAGRPLKVTSVSADGAHESTASAMTYNELGWPLQSVDADGIVKRNVYDLLGNVVEESTYASGASQPAAVTRFTYDAKGRITTQKTAESGKDNVITFGYDAFGRITSEVHSKNGVKSRDVATEYDVFGRETRIEDRKTQIVSTFQYAGEGKKRSTTNLSYRAANVTATVDAMGRETTQAATLALPAGLVAIEREVAWDTVRNLPQSATVRVDGTARTMTAEFDITDRLTSVTGGLWATGGLEMEYHPETGSKISDSASIPWAGGLVTTARTFGFTPAGRVSTVTVSPSRTISYSWDASGTGELTAVTDGGATTTFTNQDGHVATATRAGVTTTYAYDDAGRRESESSGTTTTAFGWTGDDVLATWTRTTAGSVSASATHTYDGDGQRMGSSVFAPSPWSEAATNTAYTYGFDGLALRYLEAASEGASATITYLTHSDGRAYAASYVATRGEETTGVVFQLMVNDHGDVVALADSSGEVFARYGYGPFGEDEGTMTRATATLTHALATEVASANPLRYAGYCYDAWSGHYYLQARYYDPETKQFLSKDPATADGEESAYQYCAGDPIRFVDPTGLAADYSGAGRHTTLNSSVRTYHTSKNKKVRKAALKRAIDAERVERAQRRNHDRLVKARKAAEAKARALARQRLEAARLKRAKAAERARRVQRATQNIALGIGTVALVAAFVATAPVSAPVAAVATTVASAGTLVAAGATTASMVSGTLRARNDSSYASNHYRKDMVLGAVGLIGGTGSRGAIGLARTTAPIGRSADAAMDAMWMTYEYGSTGASGGSR